MKLKNPFKKPEIEVYEESEDQLNKQSKDNLFIMNWMWVLLLICLSNAVFLKNIDWKIFWLLAGVFILVFIGSLGHSVKINRVMLLVLKRK